MNQEGKNLRINGDRLWDSIMEMAKIGPGVAGGNNRQTLTDDDAKGRDLFKKWCEKEGLEMGLDTMGNMFARRQGSDPNALPVMVGSHLDTQPTGGKYDGVLGVLGGLEIIRTLNDLDIKTKHPIEIVNWTNEEGTRFAPPMLSSGVFADMHTEDWAYNREDAEGKKFGDELKRIGWRGEEPVGERKMHAFYELHIEQGPILEDENVDIGVVTHGQGLNWLQITLHGKESHTGSTPMPKRVNAGLGMAKITQLVDEIAWSHVDVSGDNLLAVDALLEIKDEMKDYIDLQLVAFPQDGLLRSNCLNNLIKSLDMGVDVIGGIPHYERTMDDGSESIKILCELAEKRGLLVDMHCDESDDPNSRHIETLTYHTNRLKLHGRVAGSHLTSMHSMDNYYFSKLIGLMIEAEMNVVPNPLINITIQGKHDNYPKRRGMTRVPEQIKAGLNVAFGHDCVMDPWYPLGSHDMLEVAHMALHIAHMTGVNEMISCFDAVTTSAAKVLHLDKYGLKKGSYGDIVILQCKDKIEALRLKPNRLYVIKKGNIISSTNPTEYKLNVDCNSEYTDLIF